jgi:hypothetical protein
MGQKAAITVNHPPDEVQRLWLLGQPGRPAIDETGATVTFRTAPGDRGTEIHVALESGGGPIDKLRGTVPLAEAKDQLRRFKQQVETGEVPRSDGTPEGESVGRKFKQRPAQPLEEAGVR